MEKLYELVSKYDRPGPRYTSYPTIPNWDLDFSGARYEASLKKAAADSDEPLSLYLHIPFCRKRCWYCGCNTTVSCETVKIDEYLAAAATEIEMLSGLLGRRKKISQFHWGGGTPTFLSMEQITGTFTAFTDSFSILDKAEISIELDPRITDRKKIDLLKSLGFNRLSIGIQDFDKDVQKAVGRNQDKAVAVNLYGYCRERGFSRINFDLIYGLPRQTPETIKKTIETTIDLRPDRIALYSFAYLPDSMAHQQHINAEELPKAKDKFILFYTALSMLKDAGYYQIGMDHFVLPEDELAIAAREGRLRRNFMGYTVDAAKDWVGLGMSAISYVNRTFAQNASRIDRYMESIRNGRPAVYRGMELEPDDLIRQYVIMELMCNFVIDFRKFGSKFGIGFREYFGSELEKLDEFSGAGLIEINETRLEVTETGKLFVRNMAMVFDRYLAESKLKNRRVQFSRTI